MNVKVKRVVLLKIKELRWNFDALFFLLLSMPLLLTCQNLSSIIISYERSQTDRKSKSCRLSCQAGSGGPFGDIDRRKQV